MDLKTRLDAVIEDLQVGKMVILVDESHRENEGDLVMAGEHVKAQDINFMAKEGRGLICSPITAKKAKSLGLSLMVEDADDPLGTKFTVSIDAKNGTTTGISMSDRAETIKLMSDDDSVRSDFCRPGHIFPLVGHPDGLLERRGHTEATLELLRMAGLKEVGVICEIIADSGEMARDKELDEFANKFGLRLISVTDIVSLLGFRKV